MPGTPSHTRLTVTYATVPAVCEAFSQELGRGAVFVPTREVPEPGSKVQLQVLFPFSAGELELEGEMVLALPEGLRGAGSTAGVVVALYEPEAELRQRIEEASRLNLPAVEAPPSSIPDRSARYPARTPVVLELDGKHFQAETLDISYNGLLALLRGVDLSEGVSLHVTIEHPRGDTALDVDGQVMNTARCHHGVMAHGIQFHYPMDRFDEVSRFVDEVSAHQHARTLATVSGSLKDNPLESVLQTFATTSPKGTLRLTHGEDEGKIVYEQDCILSVTCGLVSGAKALGRLFTWQEAAFEFEPVREDVDVADEPLPLISALLTASVERDELARLDLSAIDPEAGFDVDADRLAAVGTGLDELVAELAANAELGFPLAALLDILPASDARIYQALAELIEAGIVAPAAPSVD
jgi:Tfp pilus assembly protein PilZ